MCRVSENAKTSENITNIADITKYLDENKQPVEDRDSEENNVKLPEDKDLPGYKENEKDSYVPGQQDDDDFEKLILLPETFDLKLIKRITEVNNKEVPERIQSIDASKLNTLDANGKLVTTADYKLNKRTGNLYKKAEEELGISPKRAYSCRR